MSSRTDDKSILKMLVTECKTNSDRYLSRYIGDADEFYIELEQYVKDKAYDTRFCDLISSIISNVLEITVIIVDKSAVGYHVYTTTPLHSSDNPPADIINSNFGVLHRNEDHCDACINITSCQLSNLEDHRSRILSRIFSRGSPKENPECPSSGEFSIADQHQNHSSCDRILNCAQEGNGKRHTEGNYKKVIPKPLVIAIYFQKLLISFTM